MKQIETTWTVKEEHADRSRQRLEVNGRTEVNKLTAG